ncbi:MAG: biotin/lipoyl-binding protein [Sphingobacteriales bacterium]|nr:biotin/lipoyl-binding protein [Sphingobacteriales bacterium]
MPGEVVKVLVQAGDAVKSGDVLLILVSMKMETSIEAHGDGVIEEVFVTERSFVEAGTILLSFSQKE